jgi:hypothetical protein
MLKTQSCYEVHILFGLRMKDGGMLPKFDLEYYATYWKTWMGDGAIFWIFCLRILFIRYNYGRYLGSFHSTV